MNRIPIRTNPGTFVLIPQKSGVSIFLVVRRQLSVRPSVRSQVHLSTSTPIGGGHKQLCEKLLFGGARPIPLTATQQRGRDGDAAATPRRRCSGGRGRAATHSLAETSPKNSDIRKQPKNVSKSIEKPLKLIESIPFSGTYLLTSD